MMFKKHLWLLLLAGCTCIIVTGQAFFNQPNQQPPVSEMLFNNPSPKSTKVNFDFLLPKGGKIGFEMMTLGQLNHVPDLDSIFTSVKNSLISLKDSFKADGLVRRVDFVANTLAPPKIRIVTHSEKPFNFSIVKNELVQLKVDSDTVRISFYSSTGKNMRFTSKDSTYYRPGVGAFVINLSVNNIADIYDLPEAIMSQCLARLKESASPYLSNAKKINLGTSYKATFNMTTGKMMNAYGNKATIYNSTQKALMPTIHLGIQYARGSIIPSAAVGMQYVKENEYSTKFWRLLWEPYFIFSKDNDNKVVTHRNDFITIQIMGIDKKHDFTKLHTNGNLSVGYLAGRRGELFEKNTFKIGLPCFIHGNLQFLPEFFFNDLFRNFSPSFKMVLLFE